MSAIKTGSFTCSCDSEDCNWKCPTYQSIMKALGKSLSDMDEITGSELIQHVEYTPEQMGYDK